MSPVECLDPVVCRIFDLSPVVLSLAPPVRRMALELQAHVVEFNELINDRGWPLTEGNQLTQTLQWMLDREHYPEEYPASSEWLQRIWYLTQGMAVQTKKFLDEMLARN